MSAPSSGSSPHRRLAGLDAGALMAAGGEVLADLPPEVAGLEIHGMIGRGGMGAVYLAKQLGLDRVVAVKVVAAERSDDPLFLERLEREARTMAKLRHPHLVTVHHFERLEEGGAAIVMEHVAGGNLREAMERHPQGLPVAQAIRWIREIGSALAAAHDAGIVHRDMKPENVLIGIDGAARVGDFGLAVPLDPGATRLTVTGTTVGTVDYLAPEAFRCGEPDARGDVYALGVMLYEMLTGRMPRGNFDRPRSLRPELPRALDEAVMKALRPEPAERFSSMAGFLTALETTGTPSWTRRMFLPAAGLAGGVAALGGWRFFPRKQAAGPVSEPLPDPIEPVALEEVGRGEDWTELSRTLSLPRDTISGVWRREGRAVTSDDGVCILALRDEMPAAYTVRAVFTRLSGDYCAGVFFRVNGMTTSVDIDGWDMDLAGVQTIDGQTLEQQTGAFRFPLEDGRRYELTVEVRPETVKIWIDGRQLGTVDIAGRELAVVYPWMWDPSRRPAALAIGSYQSPTRFESVAWRPLDG